MTPRVLILAVVAGLGLMAPASAGRATNLHRDLHLPELEPGQPCPVSQVDQRFDWDRASIFGGSGIGPGPVYPGLGGSDPPGHIHATRASFDPSWFRTKVFWYVKPSYRGPALLRGARLDGPGRIRFQEPLPGRPKPQFHISRFDPQEDSQWRPRGARGRPSGVFVRSAGCYGVQMDGTRFSRVVVFTASTED